MNKILLLIGGIINLLFSLLHLTLGKALNWSETLSCLTLDNRATIYTLNIHLAFTCLVFAYLSLFHRKDMLKAGIGRAITAELAYFTSCAPQARLFITACLPPAPPSG